MAKCIFLNPLLSVPILEDFNVNCGAMQASHASLADRMGYIEEHMGDSFEKHAKASMARLLCKVPLLGDTPVYGIYIYIQLYTYKVYIFFFMI